MFFLLLLILALSPLLSSSFLSSFSSSLLLLLSSSFFSSLRSSSRSSLLFRRTSSSHLQTKSQNDNLRSRIMTTLPISSFPPQRTSSPSSSSPDSPCRHPPRPPPRWCAPSRRSWRRGQGLHSLSRSRLPPDPQQPCWLAAGFSLKQAVLIIVFSLSFDFFVRIVLADLI